MSTFETSTTVQPLGDVRVVGVPFAPGTEVEVTISPKRNSAAEFGQAWERVCRELRSQPQMESLTDEQIQTEIDDFRAGR
jgi:hypothetical protein